MYQRYGVNKKTDIEQRKLTQKRKFKLTGQFQQTTLSCL